jgi:hypothetical protein
MKKRLCFALLLPLLSPALAFAQSGFDGTWKVDLKSMQFPSKPDEYLLQDGMYHCKSCTPPIDVKADGKDQKVTGDPYYDTINVKVVDNNTIESTQKKNGKVMGTGKATVSADGSTLTMQFINTGLPAGEPVHGKFQETRVAKGPAGAHAISGSWRPVKMESMTESALVFTIKVQGDTLKYSTPTGQSYSAKLDGTDAPYIGDPGTTSVSVKFMDKNTLEETDKRDGKVILVQRITLSADGKSLTIVSEDKQDGTTTQFKAIKQ